MQTAIWIPPSLCGCRLKVTATWRSTAEIVGGYTFKHPEKCSVYDVQIVSVCDEHKDVKSPDVSRHLHESPVTGIYQARGYLRHHECISHHNHEDYDVAYGYKVAPVITGELTPAQHLYEYLCQYRGFTHSVRSCGCTAHLWLDETGKQTYIHKPGVTQKCRDHLGDTPDMQQALADHAAREAAVKTLAS